MFMYSICNCSRSSNTANVFKWNACATVVSMQYVINTRMSIRLFNGQATRFRTWVCRPFLTLCIFPIPRVFYHCHTSFTTMLIMCYATTTNLKNFFFSTPTVMVWATPDGVPPFYAVYTLYHTAMPATTLPATLTSMPCPSPRW